MRISLYGRKIEVTQKDGRWWVFYLGSEGKKRVAGDIIIPATIMEEELIDYLADLFHEWSQSGSNHVFEIKE